MKKALGKYLRGLALIIAAGSLFTQEIGADAAKAGEAAEELILFEDGFESGETGRWRGKDGAALSIVEDKPNNGKYCLKISDRKMTVSGAQAKVGGMLKGNHLLKISAYARYEEGPGKKRVQLTLKYGGNYYALGGTELQKGVWGEITGSRIIPAGIDLSDAEVFFETPWVAEPTESQDLMDIYVDDVKASLRPFCDTSGYPSLKELYKDEFLIGTAAPDGVLDTAVYSDLLMRQFNSMTMENEMKPAYIMDEQKSKGDLASHKESVALNFDSYKKGLAFAKEHGIKMRGHTLVWHSQTPDWFFYENYDTSGPLAGRELMLKRMGNYIKEVIAWTEANYPGVIYAWDVANEAAADPWGDDADHLMRQKDSLWYQTIGEDFVQKAFAYARNYTKQYAPDHEIKLFYNDYNEYFTAKTNRIVEMLKPIKEAGNIDGIGMQSHFDTNLPLEGENGYMTAVRTFRDKLGLELHVTELDIGIAKGHTAEYQGEYYQKFMEALLKEKKDGANITSVTFWGLSDELSWRPQDNCLLFAGDLSRKPAFEGVADAIGETGTVISLIKAIGTVTADEECRGKIEAARNAYESLTKAQKGLVANYGVLEEAEETYRTLLENPPMPEKKPLEKAKLAKIAAQCYNGKKLEPKVTVTYDGEVLSGSDYEVSYWNNKNIGTASVRIIGKGDYVGSLAGTFQITVKKNKIYTVGNYKYRITNANTAGVGTVAVAGGKNKQMKSIRIADTVNIGGKKFKVTAIGSLAFQDYKKAADAVIGKNVTDIGKNAFCRCSKLKKITIRGTSLKKVGKNAVKGISPRARIKCPKGKAAKYKKLFRASAGYRKTMHIK